MKTIKGERTAIFHNSFPFIIDLFFLLLPTVQLFLECICIFFLFFLLILLLLHFFLIRRLFQLCLSILFRLLFRIFLLFCCSTNKTMGDFIWFYIFAIFFFPKLQVDKRCQFPIFCRYKNRVNDTGDIP